MAELRRSRRRRKREAGAVYVEFLVAFPIMLMFFLCLTQLGLIYTANLSVEHAATRAARAAVVVLPDRPDRYGGDPINQIDPEPAEPSSAPGSLGTILEVITALGHDSSNRMDVIRRAAWIPLIPISPSTNALTREFTVTNSLDSGVAKVAASAVYASASTAVTFYAEPESTDMIWDFEPRQEVTTRVTHLYYCSVPLARMVICRSLADAEEDAPVRNELVQAPGRILSLWSGRFLALRAESTMPNQGANYAW